MKRILVATDGSPSATEAARFGIDLAKEHDSELVFAHVVRALDVVPSTVFQIGGVFEHEPGEHDVELLDDAATLASEQGVVSTTALLRGETVPRPRSGDGRAARQRLPGPPGRGALPGRGRAGRGGRPRAGCGRARGGSVVHRNPDQRRRRWRRRRDPGSCAQGNGRRKEER